MYTLYNRELLFIDFFMGVNWGRLYIGVWQYKYRSAICNINSRNFSVDGAHLRHGALWGTPQKYDAIILTGKNITSGKLSPVLTISWDGVIECYHLHGLTFCWQCIMQWFLSIVQLDAQILFNVFIYSSLHVSSMSCSSSGETNCFNTASGNCDSVLVAVSCAGWE